LKYYQYYQLMNLDHIFQAWNRSTASCDRCASFFPTLAQRITLPRPDFPVDAVYTWVNGADPAHVAKRARYLPPGGPEHPVSSGRHLFRDNRELLFSLRSLEENAPWVRRVHLVTDNQIPDWLNSASPRLALVDHSQIIPAEFLPTFNSHVIEAYLHRIPGLAEHYIYFNDDFFLTAQTNPEDFFTPNGLPYIFTDWRTCRRNGYLRHTHPHARSWWNTLMGLARRGVPVPDILTAHGPCPMTGSIAQSVFDFFARSISDFSNHKFRDAAGNSFNFFYTLINRSDKQHPSGEKAFYSHMAPLWAYVFKRAVPCDVPWQYVSTRRKDSKRLYASLLRQKDKDKRPLFLCLNDIPGPNRRKQQRRLTEFLERRWPTPSSFERRGSE
jgi:hypothetical protein